MSALTELPPLVNPIPVPFFDKGVATVLITDILGRISGWDVLRVMSKPSTMVRYAGTIAALRELPEVRLETATGARYAYARKLAGMFPNASKMLMTYKPAAENDFMIMRWSILRDMDALRGLVLNTQRAGHAEQEAQMYLSRRLRVPPEVGEVDPVASTALWATNSLRRNCPLFARDWAEVCSP